MTLASHGRAIILAVRDGSFVEVAGGRVEVVVTSQRLVGPAEGRDHQPVPRREDLVVGSRSHTLATCHQEPTAQRR